MPQRTGKSSSRRGSVKPRAVLRPAEAARTGSDANVKARNWNGCPVHVTARLPCLCAPCLNRAMIDFDGYRPNVGIVLLNAQGQVFWARRVRRDGWQFPQGGMNTDETPADAMYRELYEETGLRAGQVEVLGSTHGWLRYRLP